MQNQIRIGHFEADGAAVNLPLGFIPQYIMLINQAAADGEPIMIQCFGTEMGDAKEIWHLRHANDGGSDRDTPVYKSSGGYIQDYDTTSVQTSDPVKPTGGKGVTISASWMDDGDEIWYVAIEGDRYTDHDDINA